MTPTLTVVAPSPDATRQFGAVLAGLAAPGDVVLLSGGLGAGKTTLVKGFVAALGVDAHVTSPTFTLLHTYPTVPVVAHVDCWRLEQLAEIEDLALDELLDDGAVALVEWGEAAAPLFGREALEVLIASDRAAYRSAGAPGGAPTSEGEDAPRFLQVRAPSPSWGRRLDALATAARRCGLEVR